MKALFARGGPSSFPELPPFASESGDDDKIGEQIPREVSASCSLVFFFFFFLFVVSKVGGVLLFCVRSGARGREGSGIFSSFDGCY